MTTSRIVRGTKARVFLYISAVLIITGVIACYNNTLSQLDDARKSSEICHQQEENLSTQLQVISDYKQRLEKSLKTEKAEHQGTKTDLENRLNEAKAKHDRSASESSLRFNSVQQQLNLLQTRHDDFKEECSSAQNKQAKEINDLQAKLKEVQQELKKVETSKENLKTQYLQIVVEKENLEKVMKAKGRVTDNVNEMNHLSKVNLDLQRELDRLKEKCSSYDTLQAPAVPEDSSPKSSSPRQPPRASLGEYQIKKSNNQVPSSSSENMPPLLKTPSKSTTASSAIKSVSQGSLNGARPLLMPTVTPKSPNKPIANKEMENNNNNNNNDDDNNVLPIPYAFKAVPDGVVQPQKLQTAADDDNNKKDDAAAVATNDRYRNKIDSEQNAAPADLNGKAKVQEAKKNEEADNGANEVFDQPLHGYDGLGFGDDKNDKQQQQQQQQQQQPQQQQQHNFHRQHIDALAMDKEANKIYDAGDYKDNMPLEENDPEEDDDGDDYDHDHLARQKDPAVRN